MFVSSLVSWASSLQILGFDILVTDELKPMLLEVNANPSLRIDYERQVSKHVQIVEISKFTSKCDFDWFSSVI